MGTHNIIYNIPYSVSRCISVFFSDEMDSGGTEERSVREYDRIIVAAN